jgi:hypothetical protein
MFDFSEAKNIARVEVNKIIETDPELSKSEVEEIVLVRENESVWSFAAEIPKLIDAGWFPGAITVVIDKNDGHILTEKEQNKLYKDLDDTRRRVGFIR